MQRKEKKIVFALFLQNVLQDSSQEVPIVCVTTSAWRISSRMAQNVVAIAKRSDESVLEDEKEEDQKRTPDSLFPKRGRMRFLIGTEASCIESKKSCQ